MDQQHPITPPLELCRLWAQQAQRMYPHDPVAWQEHIATQAAHWGFKQSIELDAAELEVKLQKARDEELEACCEWLAQETPEPYINALRAARRPKPSNLAEQALQALNEAIEMSEDSPPEGISVNQAHAIRDALERLQELEQGNG